MSQTFANRDLRDCAFREQVAFLFAPGKALMALVFQSHSRLGDDSPVLVIPGYGTGDGAMMIFRSMLERAGYQPNGWGAGVNDGFTLEDERRLVALTKDLHLATGKKVSLVGWSLGGIYARAIAQDVPDSVNQVIAMGTPWRGIEHTTLARQFELDNGCKYHDTLPSSVRRRLRRIANPLEVPFTSIFSRDDGVAYWEACFIDLDRDTRAQSIEVGGQHVDMPVSLDIFKIVDELLQMPVKDWQPHRLADKPAEPGMSPRP